MPLADPSDFVLFALALLLTGCFSGFLAGLLGVGGGIVVVPVLFQIFTSLDVADAVRMHLAVGTSLATIIVTSLASVRAHWRRGAVDLDLLRRWGPGIFVGVVAGTIVAGFVDGAVLTAVFAVVALVVALNMALARPSFRLAERVPHGLAATPIPLGIGFVSTLMGIGGGTLSVPILSLCGYPIHRAVGTASAVGFIIGVPGAIGFVIGGWGEAGLPPGSLGYVSLIGLGLILPTSMLFAPLGARAAHALPVRGLKRVFAFFLAVTAIRMGFAVLA